MRVYLPLSLVDLQTLSDGLTLDLENRIAITPTDDFVKLLETEDSEELELTAALAASDLEPTTGAVGVLTATGEIVDSELGEAKLSGNAALIDFECLLLGDVESQVTSWFGIQEIAELQAAVKGK